MHIGYPSPPLSDMENMDRSQKLPPITTQLADLLTKENFHTPPVSPHEQAAQETSAKRKREADVDDFRPAKRQEYVPSRPTTAITSASDRESRWSETPSARPVSAYSPIRPVVDGVTQPKRNSYGHLPFPPVASPQSTSAASLLDNKPHSALVRSAVSDSESFGFLHSKARILPPLITPQSPGSNADRSFESRGKSSLSALDNGVSSTPKYLFTPLSADSAIPRASSHFPSSTLPAPSLTHPQPLHLSSEPKLERPATYDPIRPKVPSAWGSGDREPRSLPPMPGVSDPIPPPHSTAQRSPPQRAQPLSHSLERYRFDGMSGAEHPARRRRGNLPKEATALLNDWFAQHSSYPYPKEEEKQSLQEQTGLTMSQIGNWFINARRRRRPSAVNRMVDPHQNLHVHGHAHAHTSHPHPTHGLGHSSSIHSSHHGHTSTHNHLPHLPPPTRGTERPAYDYSTRLPAYTR